jgi:hypothetical protein
MLMTRLYCLTHVIILFLSLITLTQNIPTLNLLNEMMIENLLTKMMIKLCLFWISVLNVLMGILKLILFIENQQLQSFNNF